MIIPVHSDVNEYNIVLENGALAKAGEHMNLNRKVLIVTDSGVPQKYSDAVAAASLMPARVCIEQGEASKNFRSFEKILSAMLEAGFTRGDCVVAVGGGVVGDLSGFAAACYMRGIEFYNIPTTLLSEVDSSIGGKTAIDYEGVKNVIGAFYQPSCVLIDPETLETLSERQIHAGLAEAIKMAATFDKELFEFIEKSTDLKKDLPHIIEGALRIKRSVVEQDPKEKGLRKVLNFGHTIGHAVEAASEGKLLHGECVAIGMVYMSSPQIKDRIKAILEKYDLPTGSDIPAEVLMPYLKLDKKKKAAKITAVYVEELGSFEFREMTPDEILAQMEAR